MTKYTISNDTYQKFILNVRGVERHVVFYFVLSSNHWYADVYTTKGVAIVKGERLVSGIDLGFKMGVEGVYIAKADGSAKDPDKTGWDGLFLFVLDEDELSVKKTFTTKEQTVLVDKDNNILVDASGLFILVKE